MKNKFIILLATMFVLAFSSCLQNNDGPTVVPPSWKGFNYRVKQATENGDTIQQERGALYPGAQIKVYAIRKNPGVYVGKMYGTIYVRTTTFFEDGTSIVTDLDKSAIQLENASYDAWEDPYATFTLPDTDKPYVSYKVEAACQFSFKTFGNQNSDVDDSDQTSHEDPYLGHIYTDLTTFHTYNGGSANSGKVAGGLKYHTIYTNY
ncbi:MAG: hypothetical protein IKT87_05785 [Bacteroidaceae bacterium]|nr:hypothetical protein [Bacteroidaceae bacterium]